MQTVQKTYLVEQDEERIEDLWLATRVGKVVEYYPTLWRLRQLLATRIWEPERDTRIWEDEQGECIGLAYLPRRERENNPNTGEMLIHPKAPYAQVYAEMLDWMEGSVQQIVRARDEAITFCIKTLNDQEIDIAVLEQKSYLRSDSGCDLYMFYSLEQPVPTPQLPTGFIIRPFGGDNEIDAYTALFGFSALTREHRLKLLAHPDEYVHQVVVAPNGRLVAYCECSISYTEWARSGRHLGWIDYIQTHEDFQRLGLGKAIMLAGLQQLQIWRAEEARLVMSSQNLPAKNLYLGLGFQAERNVYYEKVMKPK